MTDKTLVYERHRYTTQYNNSCKQHAVQANVKDGWGEGYSPALYKSDRVIIVPFRITIRGLVSFRVLKSKMTSIRGIVVHFRVLSQKMWGNLSKCQSTDLVPLGE